MLKSILILVTGMFFCGLVNAEVEPLWSLAKNEISEKLQLGEIKKSEKGVILKDGASFAVPADVFPDQKNFTVEVTASLQELIDDSFFMVMSKQGSEDSGFSFGINYRIEPWHARKVSSAVNNVFMYSRGISGKKDPKLNHPYTFTIAVVDGFATFYVDGYVKTKCFMEMIPNDAPMWIGKNQKEDQKAMPVIINSVKVYGADYKYVSEKEEKSEYPRGIVAGKWWSLDVPTVVYEDWPKVMIYGDSISMGYRKFFIPNMRKHNIYVFHCCDFVNGGAPKQKLEEIAGRYKFDVIVFNNGLHSLHWTPDKVSDEEVYTRMKDMAQSFKKGAPQAKIFYLTTTPHTAKRPGPNLPVDALGHKNETVVRLNTITEKVMKEENIPIIDVYTPLTKNLDWAIGDSLHWNESAYKFISDTIEKNIVNK